MSSEEVNDLIDRLSRLKEIGHFHLSSNSEKKSGVADIEISVMGEDEEHNMSIW